MDGEVSLAEHPVLLLIPLGMLLLFVLLWLLITTLLAAISGWFRLARIYPDRPEAPLLLLAGESGLLGPGINMRGVLRLGYADRGLRVGINALLVPFSKDFLVPWDVIGISRGKAMFWSYSRLTFGRPPVGALTLRETLAARLADAAGSRWPEAKPGENP